MFQTAYITEIPRNVLPARLTFAAAAAQIPTALLRQSAKHLSPEAADMRSARRVGSLLVGVGYTTGSYFILRNPNTAFCISSLLTVLLNRISFDFSEASAAGTVIPLTFSKASVSANSSAFSGSLPRASRTEAENL